MVLHLLLSLDFGTESSFPVFFLSIGKSLDFPFSFIEVCVQDVNSALNLWNYQFIYK